MILDRSPAEIEGAIETQLRILDAVGVAIDVEHFEWDDELGLVIDALIGYGLRDALRGTAEELVRRMEELDVRVLSLDIPSGVNATTGETPGYAVQPDETLTLALPKMGLTKVGGAVFLGDLSIPAPVYERLNVPYRPPFDDEFIVEIEPVDSGA